MTRALGILLREEFGACVKGVVSRMGCCRRTLERYFRGVLGVGPGRLIHHVRLDLVDYLLVAGLRVEDIFAPLGWSEPSHLRRAVKNDTGEVPCRRAARLREECWREPLSQNGTPLRAIVGLS